MSSDKSWRITRKAILLLVVLLFVVPSDLAQSKPVSASTEPNPEAKSLYDDGMARLEMGQVSEAVERFQRALKIDPEYGDAYSALGRAFFKLRQWENAVGPLRRAMALKAKERERQETPKLQETPRLIAAKPQPILNTPVPAPGITHAAETDSELRPPQLPRVKTNIKSDNIQTTAPPEVPKYAMPQLPPVPELKRDVTNASAISEEPSGAIVVDGLVKNPGTQMLKTEGIPLAVILAEAQPLPEAAKVTVVRNGVGQILETDLSHAADMSFLVHPGDVITLHPQVNEVLYVGGKVKFPGEKTYRLGLTLMQAIIAAGGATSNAKVAEVARNDGQLMRTRFDLKAIESGKAVDPLVKPRDRVILR